MSECFEIQIKRIEVLSLNDPVFAILSARVDSIM